MQIDNERYFRKELAALMASHGLRGGELRGIAPACHPFLALRHARRRAKGLITRRELATRFGLHESREFDASYMGFAVKSAEVGR